MNIFTYNLAWENQWKLIRYLQRWISRHKIKMLNSTQIKRKKKKIQRPIGKLANERFGLHKRYRCSYQWNCPNCSNFILVPALMYFGADVYDKYKIREINTTLMLNVHLNKPYFKLLQVLFYQQFWSHWTECFFSNR